MNVTLITSVPMTPPWDQGDKNMAYLLAGSLPHIRFRVFTARRSPKPAGDNLDTLPLYLSRRPSLAQKALVYGWLYARSLTLAKHRSSQASDLYHLIYRPVGLSSWLFKQLPEFRQRPILHTVPATGDGHPLILHHFFAQRVVAISHHGQQKLLELGVKNVVYIPPGIEVARWEALAGQTETLKARLGLAGKPVLLYPGHSSAGYGIEVLLQALPDIIAYVPQLQVIFACRLRSADDRARHTMIQQRVVQMGLAQAVHFYNQVADVGELIGASDVVVLPFQTMRDKVDIPITMLEAMAARKPVIISDILPMNEVFNGNEADCCGKPGLVTPPGNVQTLAQAVIRLMDDSALRTAMGRQGQALVREQFDIQQVARQYEKVYEEMSR